MVSVAALMLIMLSCVQKVKTNETKMETDGSVIAVKSEKSEKLSLYLVNIDGKWGYIDKMGKIIIDPQFDEALEFSEGLAVVKTNDKYVYIDITGKHIINQQCNSAYSFSEGLARMEIGGKWGFIDNTGAYVINSQFEDAKDFNEGLLLNI